MALPTSFLNTRDAKRFCPFPATSNGLRWLLKRISSNETVTNWKKCRLRKNYQFMLDGVNAPLQRLRIITQHQTPENSINTVKAGRNACGGLRIVR
ncbi:hypothetical protein Y032_0028g1763 [Ancylostoma ceylanicum]|uniref:Uncharacterized protein n=1 Tax=Ancylostoma ceylanicum TaxID=53326 RepID=A0A016UTI5_9BILA|nr:hypothetical protein Y032_0028g1763 [Ancylostoma ceylanicum]